LATLPTILTKIRNNIIDVPAQTEVRLESWVNEAQLECEAAMAWVGMDTEFVVDTVAGTRKLSAVPTDWVKAVSDPWYLTGTGKAIRMEWLPSRQDASKDYSEDTSTTARSSPKAILEVQGSASGRNDIEVYPYPDASNTTGTFSAAGEYEVHIPYHARGATLVTGGTETNFFTVDLDLQLYLEDFASGKALLFNRDYDNGQVWLLQAQRHIQRAKRLERERKSHFMKITPRRDVHASRRQRRAI